MIGIGVDFFFPLCVLVQDTCNGGRVFHTLPVGGEVWEERSAQSEGF